MRDAWLDGIQVMTARCAEGTTKGFFVAAKGGHNAESHNHNDVGNFIVYRDGRPILIDAGVETYSRKTFSSQRYEIWTMQSAYHNLPTIDGVMQSPGRQFAAREVRYEAERRSRPASARYRRRVSEAGERQIVGSHDPPQSRQGHRDHRELLARKAGQGNHADPADAVPGQVQKEGQLLLETVDGAEPRPSVRVWFDGGKLKPILETIPIEDARLGSVWPEQLTRILLKAETPALQDRWTVRIEPAEPK